jgi:hypothetical protein
MAACAKIRTVMLPVLADGVEALKGNSFPKDKLCSGIIFKYDVSVG